jgi:hypothetical protein
MEAHLIESFPDFSPEPKPTELFGKIIQEMNRQLVSGSEYRKVLNYLFESMDTLIPYDRICIALIEKQEDGKFLKSTWVQSKNSANYLKAGYQARIEGSLKNLLETRQPRIINDLRAYAVAHPSSLSTQLALADEIRSSLTFPLVAGQEELGIVFFSSMEPNTYENRHIKTFLEIADQLSLIVEYSRLREQTAYEHFLRMVLHDLKSPLAIIQSLLGVLEEEPWYLTAPPTIKQIKTAIARNANASFQLVNELAQCHDGKLSDMAAISEVDTALFFSELQANTKLVAEKKEIELHFSLSDDLPKKLFFDPKKIHRLLENLLTNAIKYSHRRTSVLLVAHTDGANLFIEVKDQGQGIPVGELSKLFKEFGKTSVRPTEGESSTGLGLAIAKRIADQHHGEITVESQINKGSAFTLKIPLRPKN